MDYKTTSLALALCVAENVPVLLWGPPGNGKTSVITQIARDYNLHLEVVIASIRDPSDFSGIPYMKDGAAHLMPPRWAKEVVDQFAQRIPSIVLYDEISTATPALQAALLRPILERVAGDLVLPAETRSIGTANPPDIAADGWELSPPIANRFTHLDWRLSAEIVKEGFTNGFPTLVMPVFPRAAKMQEIRSQSKALVGIFLGSRPELVSLLPREFGAGQGEDFSASDYAFPTPRSWETVAKLHAACTAARLRVNGGLATLPEGVLSVLLRGTVGRAAATEFLNFIKRLDLQDPNALLNGEVELKVPSRGDQIEALLNAVDRAYQTNPGPDRSRWDRYGDILSHLVSAGFADAAHRYIASWNSLRPRGVTPSGAHMDALRNFIKEMES